MKALVVSVPIWGLFNLTKTLPTYLIKSIKNSVSVPIWGLFNLTIQDIDENPQDYIKSFPSPSGDYLI